MQRTPFEEDSRADTGTVVQAEAQHVGQQSAKAA
jgi:hypothetical protein